MLSIIKCPASVSELIEHTLLLVFGANIKSEYNLLPFWTPR